MLVNDLALLLDLFGNSEETKLLICKAIFVWCSQRHRNGGLNSGLKSAIIVTDAFEKRFAHYEIYTWTLCHSYLHEKQTSRIQSLIGILRHSKGFERVSRRKTYFKKSLCDQQLCLLHLMHIKIKIVDIQNYTRLLYYTK